MLYLTKINILGHETWKKKTKRKIRIKKEENLNKEESINKKI